VQSHRRSKKNQKIPKSEIPSSNKLTANTNENADKKLIENFDGHYDDSSDEESVCSELKTYDINENWKAFQQDKNINAKNSLASDDLLSFVVHVAANKFLHSNEINKIYYPLKRKLLGAEKQVDMEKTIMQLTERVRLAIMQGIDEAFANLERFLQMTGQKKYSSSAIQKIIAEVRRKLEIQLDSMITSRLTIFINWLKVDKLCFHEREKLKEQIMIEIAEFEAELTTALLTLFTANFSADKLGVERINVKKELSLLLQRTIDVVTEKYHFSEKMHKKGKDEVLNLLSSYDGQYIELVKKISSMLEVSPANGKVLTMFNNKQNERGQSEELSQAYINDLIRLNNANAKIAASEKTLFKKYFTFNADSLNDELTESFAISLRNNLQNALKSFHRPTLGDNFQFVSHNPYNFYANLRLSNRSQKREILNKKYALFKNHSVARTWKMSDHARCAVVETQELSNGTLGRRDYVQGLSTYEKIYDDISQIKNDLQANKIPVDDKLIMEWIRAAFKGNRERIRYSTISDTVKKSMEEMLDRVAYLMHGCEAARNIAMIIIVPMLEDLIIEGDEWTLKEAFTGNGNNDDQLIVRPLMPMAPEGAVAASRSLERTYREYTPHSYLYPGVEDRDGDDKKMGKGELIKFEARVVRAWLHLKYGKSLKLPANHQATVLLQKIEAHLDHWFGLTTDNIMDDRHGNSTQYKI